MDLIDGTGFWVMGDSGVVPPPPPPPTPTPTLMYGGGGPIHSIYRQGDTPNDLALLLLLLADG